MLIDHYNYACDSAQHFLFQCFSNFKTQVNISIATSLLLYLRWRFVVFYRETFATEKGKWVLVMEFFFCFIFENFLLM